MSDAPLWVLKQYPVLVIADELHPGQEINDKLNAYIHAGGHLVITAGSLKNMPDGIAGIRTGEKRQRYVLHRLHIKVSHSRSVLLTH